MKNIILISVLLSIYSLTGLSQNINWITTSEFEMEILNKKSKAFFILIDSPKPNSENDPYAKMQKQAFNFLDDEKTVEFINSNFSCYRFNINDSDSLIFIENEYKKNESKNGRITHDFVTYLTGKERSMLPAIVLRNSDFELFEFKQSTADIKELKILLEAENLKLNYLNENLEPEHSLIKRSEKTVQQAENKLKKAEENPNSYSVFPLRGEDSKRLNMKLEFFAEGHYETSDLKTYLNNSTKK